MFNRFFKSTPMSNQPKKIFKPEVKNNPYIMAIIIFAVWQSEMKRKKDIDASIIKNDWRYGPRRP